MSEVDREARLHEILDLRIYERNGTAHFRFFLTIRESYQAMNVRVVTSFEFLSDSNVKEKDVRNVDAINSLVVFLLVTAFCTVSSILSSDTCYPGCSVTRSGKDGF